MAPIKIQLAIQGGGARLVPLLAAMEVLQNLQNDNKILITNIAGTSAGSIAGSLLAAGVKIDLVKDRLKNLRDKITEEFPIPKQKGDWLKKAKLAHKVIVKNLPIWGTDSIRKQLDELLGEKNVFKIGDIKDINLIIIATDLTQNKEHIFNKDDYIVNSILHSCGLPYFFTLWSGNNNSSVYVDGGICENFPSSHLNEGEDGQIIGISFQETGDKKAPTSLTQFTSSLLNTSMTHSVNRAKRHLTKILEIKTSISTFEIEKALTKGLEDEYELVKKQTEDFFAKIIEENRKRPRRIVAPKFQPVNLQQTVTEITENIKKMYDSHHKPFPLKYEEMRLVVTAYSLKKKKKRNDEVVLTLKFRTGVNRVFCHEVGLRTDHDTFSLKQASFEVSDKNGNEVETFYILSSPSRLIVFFETPLPPDEGPYKIICRTSVNDFVSDNKLSLKSIRSIGTIDNVELVLKSPKEQRRGLQSSKEKGVVLGSEMTKLDLEHFEVPNGFEIMGWKTNNLNPNEVFLVNIIHR